MNKYNLILVYNGKPHEIKIELNAKQNLMQT